MDQRFLLLGKVVALRQEVEAVQSSLNKMPPAFASKIRGQLAKTFADTLKRLVALEEQVASDPSDASLSLSWTNFYERRKECDPLFDECLILAQGAALRQSGLDGGLCLIADCLLKEISEDTPVSWDRFTIPARGEAFSKVPRVIRIHFPEASIWHLPVAVHEFGHFAAPLLEHEEHGQTVYPLREMLDNTKDANARAYLNEQIGDLFATYVAGPAYACTCLLLRFDPREAHTKWVDHPSDAQRAHAILRALQKLDVTPGPFTGIASMLRESWVASLAAAYQPPVEKKLSASELKALEDETDRLSGMVSDELPDAPYTMEDWWEAEKLASQLAAKSSPPDPAGRQIVDVLNAAWIARMKAIKGNGSELFHIGKRALDLCAAIAASEGVGQ